MGTITSVCVLLYLFSSLKHHFLNSFVSSIFFTTAFMALETFIVKVKSKLFTASQKPKPNAKIIKKKKSTVGILSFEISGLMSKLMHLSKLLSDKNITRLRNESVALEGVQKIVSTDESFLLGLACAEIAENIRLVAMAVSRISKRCDDGVLRSFDRLFFEYANSGKDSQNWSLSPKEMDAKKMKMENYVRLTASLHREIQELSTMENRLSKYSSSNEIDLVKEQKILDLQEKIFWQKQEVKFLKDRSMWNQSFDSVTSIIVRSIFTILARIKLVFGLSNQYPSSSLSRSLSASAAVHPSVNVNVNTPLLKHMENEFFESNSKLLKPSATTLGASSLALHYANLIIVIEKMVKSPQLIGSDARDDLYAMLPRSVRSSLQERLRGVEFSAGDPVLAGKWRDALGKILKWMSPLAHNMIRWQSERSFEHKHMVPKTNVMLLQTLVFANRGKAEAAITELLVGLNYIWRFDREMTAKALNFTVLSKSPKSG